MRRGLNGTTLLIAVVWTGVADAGELSGRARVVDGDGLVIGETVIRLHGIDAPEIGQACARATGGTSDCGGSARAALAALVDGALVDCHPLDTDQYGRVIARCSVEDEDLAGDLVDRGLAWAFVRYGDDYVAREAAARGARVGIWQADTQRAWDRRAERWNTSSRTAPERCPIKGNISAKGERIYHTPWSPFYDRTEISAAKGERWFCDEAAAVDAGWRAARF